jgi:hypothetical protein
MLVIDNFLHEDDPLLFDIQHDRYWVNTLPYNFMDKDAEPKNIWEQMVNRIWDTVSSYGVLPLEYDGVEYWNNIMSIPGSRQDLPWHFDKDEYLYNGGIGELRTPYVGSVYYAHKQMPTEGYLEIQRGEGEGDVERLEPMPNRLIIFDSGTIHRVTHITSGLRRCFATNIWINKPSEENFV